MEVIEQILIAVGIAAVLGAGGYGVRMLTKWWPNRGTVFVVRRGMGDQWIVFNKTRRWLLSTQISVQESDGTLVTGAPSHQLGGAANGDAHPGDGAYIEVQPGRILVLQYIDRNRRYNVFYTFRGEHDQYLIRPKREERMPQPRRRRMY